MPAAWVQDSTGGVWTTGSSFTASITPTTGNLLAVSVFVASNTGADLFNGISDGGTNTYTLADNLTTGALGQAFSLNTYYAKNITGGALTLTVSLLSSSVYYAFCYLTEFSGCDTVAPLDQHIIGSVQNNPGTGPDAVTSTQKTPTAANEAIYGAGYIFVTSDTTLAAGTGFILRANAADRSIETAIQTTATPVAATFTAAASDANKWFCTALMTFKSSGVAPPPEAGAYSQTIYRRPYRG